MASFGWAGQQLWQRLRTPAINLSNELWAPIPMPASTRCNSSGFVAKKIVTTGTASWAIDICGDIWTTQDTSQGWRDLSLSDGSCAQDIAVGPEWRDAIIVGCGAPGADAQIWHFTGTGWQGDNGSGVAVAASKVLFRCASALLYCLRNGGRTMYDERRVFSGRRLSVDVESTLRVARRLPHH